MVRFLLLIAAICCSVQSYAQPYTDEFNDSDPAHVTSLNRTIGGVQFDFLFTGEGDGGNFVLFDRYGVGDSPSLDLRSSDINTNTTEKITIARNDGQLFVLTSLFLRNDGNTPVTIQGYRSGSPAGAPQSVADGQVNTYNFGVVVDQVQITATDFYQVNLDDFTWSVPTNTAPVAVAPSAPAVNWNTVDVALADNIQVSDANGDSQTVTFTVTGGTVSLGTSDITFGGSGNGSASFTAAGTLADINAALDAATFTPTPNLYGTNAGTISFVSNDGTINSNPATVTFDITSVNNAPVVSNTVGNVFWTEGNPPTTVKPLIGVSDPDGDNITKAIITNILFVPGDELSVATPGPYAVDYNSSTGVLTLSGIGTAAEMQAALRTVGYRNSTDNPGLGNTRNTRILTFFVEDDNAATSAAVGNPGIFVSSVNDAPTVTLPASISVLEDTNSPLTGISFADADAGSIDVTTTFSVPTGTLAATSGGGVTVSGSGTGNLSLDGPLTAINSFIAGANLNFLNEPGNTNDQTLTVSINDNGNTGTGGALQDNVVVTITVTQNPPVVTSVAVPANGTYGVSQDLDFTVTFDDDITLNTGAGVPSLSLTVGSSTKTATYISEDGTNALVFRYTVQTGDLDADGISVGSAISLNGGTLRSGSGIDANLALDNIGNTDAVRVDGVAPSGYTVQIDQDPIDRAGQNTVSFTFSGAEPGATFSYTFSGAGTDVSGSGTITTSTDQITGISLAGLADGTVTLNAALTDPAGNTGTPASDVATKHTNDVPTASDVSISGTLTIEEVLTGSYTYADEDADTESGTTYQWYRSVDELGTGKTAIPGADTEQYTLQPTDKGAYISFEVVPNDGNAFGAAVESALAGPVKINQLITFPGIPTKTYGAGSFALGDAQTDQGLDVTYTAVDPTVVSITGNQATILKSGSTQITATQGGDGETNAAAPITQTLSVNTASLTVIAAGQSKVYGDTDPIFTYSATGFANGDDESILSGALTREAGEAAGNYAIQLGTLSAGAAYAINFTGADFTIALKGITGITFGDGTFVYDGTARSLAITGTLPDGTSVAYTGNTRTDVGTQEVTATISGDNYETLVLKADLTVTEATITGITFGDGSFTYDGSTKSLSITGTLPDGTSVAYTGNTRTDVGMQEVTATISGDNYETLVLTADLTVTEATITGITLEDENFVYDGTAKSLAITGTLPEGTSVAYTDNTRTDVGMQEVTATISGGDYTDLVLTAELSVTPAMRDLTFPAIAEKTYGDADFDAGATASSGEAVSYTSSNPAVAEIVDGQIRIVGAGTATITATVPDNTNYGNRPETSRTLTVQKATQSIAFAEVGEVGRDAGSIPLDATASTGLPVSLSLDDEQVATVNGTMLTILRLGTVRITATQTGDGNHHAAEPVTITVSVVDPQADFPVRVHKAVSPNGDGINDFLMVEAIRDHPENRVTVFSRNGTLVYEASGYNNGSVAFRGIGTGQLKVSAGTYFYIVEVKVNGKWAYHKGYFVLRY